MRTSAQLEERIRRRAHEIYLQRDGKPGNQIDDWVQAEREINQEYAEALVDEASDESFPASDPPGY